MRLISVVCCFFILISCRKKQDQFPTVEVVGHAGNGLHNLSTPYHDNTKNAVVYAFGYAEINTVEVDVQFSKDGTLWLFHDLDLSEETNEDGCLRMKTDIELSKVRYRGLSRERLNKLEDLVDVAKNKTLIIDFKFSVGCGEEIEPFEFIQTITWIESIFQETEIIYSFTSMLHVQEVEQLGGKILMNASNEQELLSFTNSNFWGISIRNKDVTNEFLSSLNLNGKRLILYDVRSPKKSREALNKHPDYLFTDDIKTTLTEKYR